MPLRQHVNRQILRRTSTGFRSSVQVPFQAKIGTDIGGGRGGV